MHGLYIKNLFYAKKCNRQFIMNNLEAVKEMVQLFR